MNEQRFNELLTRAQSGPIGNGWHWLTYNFTRSAGIAHFAVPLLASLDRIDQAMPGYAEEMLSRIEQLGGRVKDDDHYDAIMQNLAEVVVVANLIDHRWPAPVRFEMEPIAPGSAKNPEVAVELDGVGTLGVEVKSPKLREHQRLRSANEWQMVSRESFTPPGKTTLPRDNPVKDFLISADAKFAGFKAADSTFQSVLVIVWDDFVNEPLAALAAESSGLLTPNSFHRDGDGYAVTYPNVDAVVVIRHLHQLHLGAANDPPMDQRRHYLDYGRRGQFPFHVILDNPASETVLAEPWRDALEVYPLAELRSGADYNPGQLIMWVGGESD